MGLFSKKPLKEMLEQREDQILSNQISAIFYPDPTWAYEKDTNLPVMFNFSDKLGNIPYSAKWLGKKGKKAKAIGSSYHNEIVNIYTYIDVLDGRGARIDALVPFFVEMYGMKENLIDHCGDIHQIFKDASYDVAMTKLDRAIQLKHEGAFLIRRALQNVQNIGELFPYSITDDQRDDVVRIIDFCENQQSFLSRLLEEAKNLVNQISEMGNPKRIDYFELKTDIQSVVLWLAMHKVPWALRMYCDGSLTENSQFPIGYYYSRIDTNYFREEERRDKAYAYSIEKGLVLLKEAEKEYVDLKKSIQGKDQESTNLEDSLLSAAKELYHGGLYQKAFDVLMPLVDSNNREALQLCAQMLLNNQVRPVTWDLTFKLLESEYDRGNKSVCELLCSLYIKKGNITTATFWGNKGLENGYPDCAFILAQYYEKNSERYKDYLSKGAIAGSPICCYYVAMNHYSKRNGFLGKHYSARYYAQKALDGGIEEARDLIKAINDDERYWDAVNAYGKLAELENSRLQQEREQRERAEFWQKELQFISSLNDPFTARDSTGRVLTVDPRSATATDGSKTYSVSEENLKNLRVERILNRKD